MKQIVIASYSRMSLYILFFAFLFNFSTGCKKDNSAIPNNNVISSNSSDATNASSYSADVIDKWMTMQIRLERDAVGIPNVAFVRYYAYSGIAAAHISGSLLLSGIRRSGACRTSCGCSRPDGPPYLLLDMTPDRPDTREQLVTGIDKLAGRQWALRLPIVARLPV